MTAGGAQPATLSPPRSAALLPTGASADSPATAGLTEAEAARRLAERGPPPRPQHEPLVREHRPRQRLHRLQPDPRRRGRDDAGVRRLAGRALPRRPRRERGDRLVQEIRAKRALDRLSALVAPQATVVRDGEAREIAGGRGGAGDLVRVGPATRSWPTGRSRRRRSLRVDESILTGESRPVEREAGEEVRSGSFAVEGTAVHRHAPSATRATRRGSPARRARSAIPARRSSAR